MCELGYSLPPALPKGTPRYADVADHRPGWDSSEPTTGDMVDRHSANCDLRCHDILPYYRRRETETVSLDRHP